MEDSRVAGRRRSDLGRCANGAATLQERLGRVDVSTQQVQCLSPGSQQYLEQQWGRLAQLETFLHANNREGRQTG